MSFGFYVEQRYIEAVPYAITTTHWGSNPQNVACTLYDVTASQSVDVSSECLDDEVYVEGDVITTPRVKNLVVDHHYWLECEFEVIRGAGRLPAKFGFYLFMTCVK